MTVRTRFAPSPTGYLHIGGARTALFNWLFAKHHGGQYLLRIEDTDRARSTDDAIHAIFDSLTWLGLDWDEEPVMQFSRAERHTQVARQLLSEGKAYYCYCSPEELEEMRETARANNLPPRYDGRWRDRDPREAPEGVKPVIRFKAPQTGETIIDDQVQGTVRLDNSQLDDMVLLRADGTPTYMLSVVVDDHDMAITHIIRGDDHLTNAFRQYHLYQACGWDVPVFAHIPLIHGADGAKLSKRHGALGTEAYRDMGYLPEAMRNYLLRLGWAHGDAEIISTQEAIEWFDVPAIGRSPSRFDMAKLNHLNAHYMRHMDESALLEAALPFFKTPLNDTAKERILKGMNGLKQRATTLIELADNALIYVSSPDLTKMDDKAKAVVTPDNMSLLRTIDDTIQGIETLSEESVERRIRELAEQSGIKVGAIAQVLRVALTGKTVSPSLFEVIAVLGKDETHLRIQNFLQQ